jgi:hypothetical protein
MNKQAGAIVVSILFAVVTAGASYAAETTGPLKPSDPMKVPEGSNVAPDGGTPRSVVTGELLKINGQYYVVKDQSGKDVHFQIDERTRMSTQPKVGDQIRVQVEPQGYASSINMASVSTQEGTPDKKPTAPPAKSDLPETIKK